VAEGHRRQPVDADVDVGRGFLAPGRSRVAPARRARADEHGVEALGEELLQRIDAVPAAEVHAEVEHVAHLLVDHALGQAELGIWLRIMPPARRSIRTR
jgi:hypothetical protein